MTMLRITGRGFVVIQIEAVEMITGELRPRAPTALVAPRRVIGACPVLYVCRLLSCLLLNRFPAPRISYRRATGTLLCLLHPDAPNVHPNPS